MAKTNQLNYDDLIYIGIGSNLGNRLEHINESFIHMQQKGIEIIRCASIYQSTAWGFESDELFYNTVIECNCDNSAEELLLLLKEIERAMGRSQKTGSGYENRVIDLDILLYRNQLINVKTLLVPHAQMKQRNFVLYPLEELVKTHIFSSVGKTFKLLINELKDDSSLFIVSKPPFINQQKDLKR